MKNENRGKFYGMWIVGLNFGFEFFEDDEGGAGWVLSLGLLRILYTKHDLDGSQSG